MRMDLVDRLYEKIMEEPLRPKVLLARSYAEGHQWLEQICKRKGSVYNVAVQTLSGVVIEKAGLGLFQRQVRLLDGGQSYWFVRYLMKQLAMGERARYIIEDMLKPGIVDRVHRAITELRLAGVHTEQIQAARFSNPNKGGYLRDLLSMYETYLRDHWLMDAAGMVDYLHPVPDETLYLAAEPTGWSKMERAMADKLACGRLYLLEADDPFYISEQFAANSFVMFRASGTMAEIREGFRRMLSEPAALDRTEIILSDYERYAPVVHAHAELLGIECTFANGLPPVFCAAGRAAVGLLDWIEEGYPATKLAEMLRHGEIMFQDADDRWSQEDCIRLLERSGIGWGKDRYVRLLQPDRLSEEDRELGASLLSQLEPWLAGLPDGTEWDPIRLLAWLSTIVRNHTAARSPDDGFVQSALQEMTDRHASSPSDGMPMDMAIRYLRDMLASIRVRVSATPKPGALHVSSMQNGGWSGRERTWIAGMDERAWSVPASQDPVLLDEERAAISAELETMSERARLIRRERESRLALIRGEVWLSYASYDTGEQKSQSPAFEMLQVWRLQIGDANKDFGELAHALGQPYGVMDIMHPAGKCQPIDASDAWTGWLMEDGGRRREGQQVLHRAYPALAAGYRAQTLRQEAALSAYDGWLDLDSSADPDGSEAEGSRLFISASQLEHYARCGMQYYFSYVLKLRPKEAAAFDRTRWLQPVDKGNLLHRIFRLYLEEATAHGGRPAAHDRARLTEITELAIREFELRIPAPSPHVFAKECEEIRQDVEIFYRKESSSADQPCFFELELTLDGGEPMEVALPGGIRVRLRGFIDRIDRIGPHRYRIIDYKTGSAGKYAPSEYFSGGTQLQHALYAISAEQWLRLTGYDPAAEVAEADYVFPTERGRGDAIRRMQNRREELAAVVSRLLESQARGLYIPTKDEKQCAWCDYQAVCGHHAKWMADKRKVEDNAAVLGTLLEVEEIG